VDFLGIESQVQQLQQGDVVVVVPTIEASRVTPHAEAFQAVVWHCLVSHPKLQRSATKW